MNISSNIPSISMPSNWAQGIDSMSGASGYVPPANDSMATMRAMLKQNSQDFKDLKVAMKSGNLDEAKKAYSALQQDIQKATATYGKSPFDPSSPIGKDFDAIGKALAAGDTSTAKQAFQAMTHDMRTAHRGHHSHPSETNPSSAGGSVSTISPSNGGTGSNGFDASA